MRFVRSIGQLNSLAKVALRPLQSPFLLVLRVYVSWQFLVSGWLKLQDWDTTLVLFEQEYRVPLLSSGLAAVLGTMGETLFPLLLVAGLLGRYAALGLFAVNVMAVVSYAHVLLAEGYEAALAQHVLWGVMLATLVVVGPGRWSVDGWLERLSSQEQTSIG
jgi:putative oxidoreductase